MALIGLAVLPVVSEAQSLTANLPAECDACKGPEPHIGTGSFRSQARRLRSYVLPEARLSDAREEPWVFSLTVNIDGIPCAVTLKDGPDGPFARSLLAAARKWRFYALIHGGHATCFSSLVYCYVRVKESHVVLIVPGVTEPY
jgi:hypothetical protein